MPHLNGLLIITTLLISTAPLYAQQKNVAKLKEDARNVVGTIGSDKTKTQTYCQILDSIAQLDREKDSKKAKALSQKIDQLQKQLGPEFLAVPRLKFAGRSGDHFNKREPQSILSGLTTCFRGT
jgi:hypothetical protein